MIGETSLIIIEAAEKMAAMWKAEAVRLQEALIVTRTALKRVHENRLADDGGICICAECSQCIARVALEKTA